MLILLVILAAGILLAFFSGQNSAPVTMHLGNYFFPNIPMYVVILGSFFVGVFLSWILSAFGAASHALRLMGKDKEINRYQHTTADLQNRIRQLELENAKLRGDNHDIAREKEVKDEHNGRHIGVLESLREKMSPSV